jgi:GTP-binding protein EngB required for normal cell division
LVDEAFYLVDAPGYGSTIYANLSTINFAKMMEEYVKEPSLKAIVFLSLISAMNPGKDDVQNSSIIFKRCGVPLINVLTKVRPDEPKRAGAALKMAKELGLKRPDPFQRRHPLSLDPLKAAI